MSTKKAIKTSIYLTPKEQEMLLELKRYFEEKNSFKISTSRVCTAGFKELLKKIKE
ncbi:hypothetical protein [Williamsoniiplasma lucivorax]|uniref:Uncharacterized protein n=1 Tax=Williamsoniiplasma lucivorax TaxID=209274 RepID=A0A2S5RF88_9MOLU|nr:hypothetical protein [Williamsoniiplasma lucivorax]PPE05957.1 hypothetical protein ELUCI_v1c02480 [Williamsoniiplasma lucivorax]